MVCKNWRRLTHGTRPGDTFPWLFSLKDWCYGFFKPQKNLLYNPVCSHIDSAYYWVNNKAKHKCSNTSTLDLYSSQTTFRFALAVRFGWLLGDKEWKAKNFSLAGFDCDVMGEIFKLECVKGTLYSVFTSGTVGAFDLFWRKALDRVGLSGSTGKFGGLMSKDLKGRVYYCDGSSCHVFVYNRLPVDGNQHQLAFRRCVDAHSPTIWIEPPSLRSTI
ncbi:hypothetical protein TIFTF001_000817 [Ficus carica]|uniref:Uncharacterized protein n=1 Tax=Ficus carica TaxID=3494 RepID=A0AA87ZIW8_FICCA|nr:hypothetical protein TIFTF001_000817 [Ficus carica]